ncbi:aminopeptidase N [Granulicella aggregans]|uniref:Aminopeptidase N n=1 Tax=Granulicella aggregans TaxID=474949 RepID=A0A7W7ZBP9_9BACT|nr:M1 family aminopeptidase [Granulicella aggregans]MBB5056940.1 aminopeptidase N [Granulicella aggregans]
MAFSRGIPTSLIPAAAFLLALSLPAMAITADPGVSHELAIERIGRLSHLQYRLSLSLKEHEDTVVGTETLSFESNLRGDLPIDYRDGVVQSATLNGQSIPTDLKDGHLILPAMAGRNILEVKFRSNSAAAGKAITRYDDKDDGSEYFYTLFVPMDASMAFPCFDQPDLKARFTLDVEHPAKWTVISNTSPAGSTDTATHFAETLPISTYLFAFAAGPFATIHPEETGQPTLYVRRSQLARATQEAPQVQALTAQGVAYFSRYFSQPFPFSKYDLILIPGFPFGGMEHAGATFLNEDSVLFRSTPTASDYFRRNILVLHETCHQWFGDLVTMKWFDDLWLKEGFAQYMAYKALAELQPSAMPWKHFYEDIKPLAYGIDETEGTTPIFQNIENLKDAKSAYGAIVYQKAPAILKQLEFRIGPDVFREGLRSYLKQHAYGNAQWSDLIAAFKSAEPLAPHAPTRSIHAWAEAWIKHRGMPEINVAWSCTHGKIDHLALTQHDVLSEGLTWPISNQISLNYSREAGQKDRLMRVDWNGPTYSVADAVGMPCPAFVFANAGDEGYGRFLLDQHSEAAVSRQLIETPISEQDPLLRTMLWGALWQNVHVAKSSPRSYVELALKSLPMETDESLARVQGGRIALALHSYLHDAARIALVPQVESVLADRMRNAPELGLRIVSFRSFINVAETPAALRQVKDLLAGSLVVPGMPLELLDRWNLVAHLIAMNDLNAANVLSAEKARDHSGEAQKYAYAAGAGTPSAVTKAHYFDEYLHDPTIQEDWITQSLRPFSSWNQSSLTLPYLSQALNELPEIKQHRKIFFLGAWLGAFLEGQNTPEAQQVVRSWLSNPKIDRDLRLKVLESMDGLDRAVFIRKTFPL